MSRNPIASVVLAVAIFVAAVYLSSCGGGAMASQPVPAAPAPLPPPVATPPPAIPSNWTVTDLVPVDGATSSQANAVNSLGQVAGYSMVGGIPHVTEWDHGLVVDMGVGVATGISSKGDISSYRNNGLQTVPMLNMADLPLLAGYDSATTTGINDSGVVVGIAYQSTDTSQETAVEWVNGQIQAVPGCAAALAINNRGQIAGISTNLEATICGMPSFGVPGAAGAINTQGMTVGYSLSPTSAYLWPSTQIAANAQATGINDYGWVVGETFTSSQGNAIIGRQFHPNLVGTSHPWICACASTAQAGSQQTGIVNLPTLATTTAISGTRIVGAGFVGSTVHGFLLTGK